MTATLLVPCASTALLLLGPLWEDPRLAGEHGPAAQHDPAAEPRPWPTSERALLGAVLVDGEERRVATVLDAFFDAGSGEVLHLAIEPRGASGAAVRLERREVRWQFERQRFSTELAAAELARRPSSRSDPRSSAVGLLEASILHGGREASPSPRNADRSWSLADLCGSELRVGRRSHAVVGLVLDPGARRVLGVVVARGAQEVALPPAALGRAPDGRLFLRDGSRAWEQAPAARGPALDSLNEAEFRAAWEEHWHAAGAPGRP